MDLKGILQLCKDVYVLISFNLFRMTYIYILPLEPGCIVLNIAPRTYFNIFFKYRIAPCNIMTTFCSRTFILPLFCRVFWYISYFVLHLLFPITFGNIAI